ncbi:MFS transporter, ACS family, hexuronate transporter [Sphingomonas gellani]|uniref:MFS transporter, ACS family, hexuronate transporter n=1 Tax=Sphingomonas gellani TaxID=1166340 RepID=A0A1H8D923_9SPHN|nr:MFS transporter [Sphingomonas gellani]SEN03780.1 MFS transporter, ACS family, hexuronate transporter [Sphingomonas gellani]
MDGSTEATAPGPPQLRRAGGNVRWVICALLFFATTINYIDRQVIGILKPTLQTDLGWSEVDYGMIVFWFQAAYAIGLLACGPLIDRLGSKMGYAAAITVWSLAALAHALVRSPGGFSLARFALGLGESANFPAAIKSVAEWFPKKERALAAGILNAGANVGAIATPLVVPIIALNYGWRTAFVVTGLLGFVWLAAWLAFYRAPERHPRLSAQELAYIGADQDNDTGTATIPWRRLFRYRGTWAFLSAKFLTDPVWYLFLFWLPDFFAKRHGLDLKTFGPPLIAVYLLADVGSIGGGWLSSALIKRGYGVNAGRKLALLASAVLVLPIVFASSVSSLSAAVAIIGVAAAAHQGWSSNLYTMVSDTFPKSSVASVMGIGGAAGAVGGMIMARYVGEVLEHVGSYVPVFIWAGSAYLVALLIVHILLPKLDVAAPPRED